MARVSKLPSCVPLRQWILQQADRLSLLPKSRHYTLTVGRKPAFVWFQIPKVASRSILTHFESHGVNFQIPRGYDIPFAPELYRDHFKFSFVRNPWDRLVSCWQNKIVENGKAHLFGSDPASLATFDRFVDHIGTLDLTRSDIHVRLQCVQIDLNHLDFLGRFERFEIDFARVCDTLGLPGELKKRTTASGRDPDYRIYYTDPLVEKVASMYRRDIDLFGYTFNPPNPTP